MVLEQMEVWFEKVWLKWKEEEIWCVCGLLFGLFVGVKVEDQIQLGMLRIDV